MKLEGLRFLPPSCSGLKWETKNELHLRLQVECHFRSLFLCFLSELFLSYILARWKVWACREWKDAFQLSVGGEDASTFQTTWLCRQMHLLPGSSHPRHQVRKSWPTVHLVLLLICFYLFRFERVLPLPSDNFFEMPETLFCHQSPTDTKHQISRTNLLPRNKDCFVAPAYFLVTLGACNPGAFVVTESSVKCSRCDCKLGSVLRGNLRVLISHSTSQPLMLQFGNFFSCFYSKAKVMKMLLRRLSSCQHF